MNVKSIIIICLLVGSRELEGSENVTNTLPAPTSQNQTSSTIEKKIDTAQVSKEEDSGFMSKLGNLIFGSSDDAVTSETKQSVQYGPPPASRNGFQQDCNPCNKEPWIPIMTNYGHNKLVGFMQSHNVGSNGHGGLYNQHNFPSGSYGTPVNHGHQSAPHSASQSGYSPPSPHVLENFKPPQQISSGYGLPNLPTAPQELYGPPAPPSHQYEHSVQSFQPPPPSDNYGAPPVPSGNYGPAPSGNYGPPPAPSGNYGPPPVPSDNYGPPPAPSGNYGPPPEPSGNYGPPPVPSGSYGPPSGLSDNYGPPPPSSNYGPPPPSSDYGSPISAPSFSAPNVFNKLPPPASLTSSVSNFGNHYGAPKPIFKIPSKNYGPPINQHSFGLPKPGYSSGKAPRQIRPGFSQRPHMQFGPPQPVYKYIPLNKGKFTNLPTNFKPPPPPPNYDAGGPTYSSFGTFVNHGAPAQNHDIKVQVTNPEYLPPPEQLPIASAHNSEPIAFPNLSHRPVAPLHNPQNFLDNFPQPGSHVEIPYDSNVQIQQSIPIADFVASIEHPINVIRSPILDVDVANTSSQSDGYYSTPSPQSYNNYAIQPTYGSTDTGNYDDYKLSENPIVVEDTHVAAATNENKTVSSFNNLQSSEVSEDFIQQILNGINGPQTYQTPPPSTSMQPPPIGESPWLAPSLPNGRYVENVSTKKPKQIQIIIPYTTNNEYDKSKLNHQVEIPKHIETHHGHHLQQGFTPVTEKQQQPTSVVNIQEFFKNNKNHNMKNLPFDVIRLQKNIDGWTEQEYSKNIFSFGKSSAATSSATSTTKFISSKRIPDDYLTTLPYNVAETKIHPTTPRSTPKYLDHEPAGSNSKEYKELQSNLIATIEQSTTPKSQKLTKLQSWDKIHVAVSPLTKEKIYVVTPQPKTTTSTWRQSRENERNSTTFSISIIPMRNKTEDSNDVRVVLSEWPHLINNLATITKNPPVTTTTTPQPTSRHPLFGLMDLASYTPPANSTIETYSGHSKVINVATASLKKRGAEEKKVTTTMKSTSLK